MNIVRIVTLIGALSTVSGCATLSYPLPKCDGYAKRPLNRSMWDWDVRKTEANKQQSSLTDGNMTVLAFADSSDDPAVEIIAFTGFDEAGSHTTCRAG